MLSAEEQERLRCEISDRLVELEDLFKPEMKLSFFARNPEVATSHVFVGSDTLEGLRQGVDELAAQHGRAAPPLFDGLFVIVTPDRRPLLDSISTREQISWARVDFRRTAEIKKAMRDGWTCERVALVKR